MERSLVEPDREAQPGGDRIVLGVDVLPPQSVPLLQAQRVEGPQTSGDHPVVAAGVPQQLPRAGAHLERPVQLPPELPDVGDPLREHRHLSDVDRVARQVGERVVRHVVARHRGEDLPRARAPQAEAERARRPIDDPHALPVADLPAQPGEIVHRRPAAGHDLEQVP